MNYSDTDELEDKNSRRRVINADNNIDIILAGRAKKTSISIPEVVTLPGKRLRKHIFSEKEFNHLMGEVTGERYDNPCRPELECLTLGFEHRTERIRILLDDAKCLFLLSKQSEDQIINLINTVTASEQFCILTSVVRVGLLQYNCLDNNKQRLFRRFMREHITPLLKDPEYVKTAVERITSKHYEHLEGIESDSETSEEEEEVEVKEVQKAKIVKRNTKLVKSRATTLSKPLVDRNRLSTVGGSSTGNRRTIATPPSAKSIVDKSMRAMCIYL